MKQCELGNLYKQGRRSHGRACSTLLQAAHMSSLRRAKSPEAEDQAPGVQSCAAVLVEPMQCRMVRTWEARSLQALPAGDL